MNEIIGLVPALVAGLLLGMVFFGGLWWTVRKGLASARPVRWFFGSLILRTSLTLAGFYMMSDGHWERLLMGIVGFTIARQIVTRLTRIHKNSRSQTQEGGHAS